MPKTDREWALLQRAFRDWRLRMALCGRMIDGGKRAEAQGSDPVLEAVRAYFWVYRLAPWLVAADMEFATSRSYRQEATIEFSGWVATKISARYNKRLRAKLGGGSAHEVHGALLEQLPAAVLEAWYDLDPNSDPLIARTHVANLLSDGGQRRRKKRLPRPLMLLQAGVDLDALARVYPEIDGRPLAEVLAETLQPTNARLEARGIDAHEEFAGREEAARMDALADSELRETMHQLIGDRGLTEREELVFYLRRVEKWNHPQIARRLGIKVSTSKTTYLHARRKVDGLLPRANLAL